MTVVRAVLVGAWMVGLVGAAHAQDVAAGARVAERQCTGCHQIARAMNKAPGIAPSFVEIANSRGMTETSIEVFLRTSHEGMPNFVLRDQSITDVAAYIISLRKPRTDAP